MKDSILFSAKYKGRDGNPRFPVLEEAEEPNTYVLDISGGNYPSNGSRHKGTFEDMKDRLLERAKRWTLLEVRANEVPGEIPVEEGDGTRAVEVTVCDNCGEEVPLYNPLVNKCPMCPAEYSGTGQRLRDGHNTGSKIAQERGRDPGVGRPGHGPITR